MQEYTPIEVLWLKSNRPLIEYWIHSVELLEKFWITKKNYLNLTKIKKIWVSKAEETFEKYNNHIERLKNLYVRSDKEKSKENFLLWILKKKWIDNWSEEIEKIQNHDKAVLRWEIIKIQSPPDYWYKPKKKT